MIFAEELVDVINPSFIWHLRVFYHAILLVNHAKNSFKKKMCFNNFVFCKCRDVFFVISLYRHKWA